MTDDAFKKAEQRGYAKGYVAGKARLDKDVTREQYLQASQEFLEREFLVALPLCIEIMGWKTGDKPINTMEERVRRCNEEDTDLHREIYGLHAKHHSELRREEEKGYARGLADLAPATEALKIFERHASLILETKKPTPGLAEVVKRAQDALTDAGVEWRI